MPKTSPHEKLKAKVLVELLGPNPPSIAALAQKYKLAPALVDVWRRGALMQQRLKGPAAVPTPSAKPAPVESSGSAAGLADEVARLKTDLEAKDRRIAELLETVAGLSSLLVKKL